ncbi:MAG: hypothetical protein LBP29_00095 [Treponema sp.]|nr:hypothetical protein [Treponema sp.]
MKCPFFKTNKYTPFAGLLVLSFLLGGCGPSGIDFSDSRFGFLAVDESPPGAAKTYFSLVDYGDGKAVRADMAGAGTPYIVIDASGLLGKNVAKLRVMEITLALERNDGEFYAASGEIRAYSGKDRSESADSWSVYLPEKNPNTVRAVLEEGEYFIPGADNFFILTRKVDNALEAGKDPSSFIIAAIRFFDAAGNEMGANSRAVFRAPEGFGQRDISNLAAVGEEYVLEKSNGSSKGWGQAVVLDTLKNGGSLDPSLFAENAVVMVYYSSANPPELILQSWSGGAGWAKVAPAAVNDSASCAQYTLGDMAEAFGTPDFAAYLDKFYVGDTGADLKVYAVSVAPLQ